MPIDQTTPIKEVRIHLSICKDDDCKDCPTYRYRVEKLERMKQYRLDNPTEYKRRYEFYNAHRDNAKERENYAKNRDKILERQKERYKNIGKETCEECGSTYHKRFRENHLESEIHKRGGVRLSSNEERRKPIECECGSVITRAKKARHEKTEKHQTFLRENS